MKGPTKLMTSTTPQFLPAHRIFKDAKPGLRYYKLLQLIPDIPEEISRQPYIDEMQSILSQLTTLLKAAVKLECNGETDEAVVIYKQLVASEFDNPYPYLRLCAYYSQKQMLLQVDIVCCCYLKMVQVLSALGFSDPGRNESAGIFIEIASELEITPDIAGYCERLLARENH